ncbi:MAG: UDP-N-acetylglucosamine--N-acetylmuramyl-(pentapeptide) pyrophosphoryl-undecaprenol N-acetylglucosamine transferase [Candidatus Tokpelaia sp. JSC188]|nr:MAG: UDP-N-acetylglucosamine--N-acetylmuramyl-(pentapeptide) pyrophosphoryl-undecaprenol N-acetylglucosamine transferase [Candidatus Tokpelaia sp. JSC188]
MSIRSTIILAAGGTGGHFFPAEAVGIELRCRGFDVHLFTDKRTRGFIDSFSGDHVHVISSATVMNKNPFTFMRALSHLMYGACQSFRLIRKLKPCLVAGFGGYPTLPPLYAATTMHIPTFIHEQNAVMGRANKFLAAHVNIIAGGFLKKKGKFAGKIIITGNPLRASVIEASEVPYSKRRGKEDFSLLIFGGSQGATFFSEIVPQALALMDKPTRDRVIITQQARDSDIEKLIKFYKTLGIRAEIQPFFKKMAELIAGAHYIISRAGALTIAEITAIGRPALLVPYPYAIDHDQMENAMVTARLGGIKIIRQEELTSARLLMIIHNAISNPDMLENMATEVHTAGRIGATQELADVAQALATERNRVTLERGICNENAI